METNSAGASRAEKRKIQGRRSEKQQHREKWVRVDGLRCCLAKPSRCRCLWELRPFPGPSLPQQAAELQFFSGNCSELLRQKVPPICIYKVLITVVSRCSEPFPREGQSVSIVVIQIASPASSFPSRLLSGAWLGSLWTNLMRDNYLVNIILFS